MQEMATPILRSNHILFLKFYTLNSQLLHGPNMLPPSSSAFGPPTLIPIQGVELESTYCIVGARILQVKEEVATIANKQLGGKKRGRPTKEHVKKMSLSLEKLLRTWLQSSGGIMKCTTSLQFEAR